MPYNFFKWVVFKHRDGRFAGLISAHRLRAFGELGEPQKMGYGSIVRKIETRNVSDLPGFIGPESELSATSTKGQAIEKLSKTVAIHYRHSVLASILRAAHSPS